MADITRVEVGDQFWHRETRTLLRVLKIWFECVDDNRWETSVTWLVKPLSDQDHQVTAKAREFVQALRHGGYTSIFRGELGEEEEDFSFDPNLPPTASGSLPPSTGTTVAVDSKVQMWEEDFRRNAAKYGLSPSDLGRRVTLNPKKPRHFTIIGAKPRNWKMPILVRGKRGGVYKITAERAKKGLA